MAITFSELQTLASKYRKDPDALLAAAIKMSKKGGDKLFTTKDAVPVVERGRMLEYVCEELDSKILRWMLSMGLPIDAKRDGEPAAMAAFRRKDVEMARVVLDAGFS